MFTDLSLRKTKKKAPVEEDLYEVFHPVSITLKVIGVVVLCVVGCTCVNLRALSRAFEIQKNRFRQVGAANL
jgi:hypothetical protein